MARYGAGGAFAGLLEGLASGMDDARKFQQLKIERDKLKLLQDEAARKAEADANRRSAGRQVQGIMQGLLTDTRNVPENSLDLGTALPSLQPTRQAQVQRPGTTIPQLLAQKLGSKEFAQLLVNRGEQLSTKDVVDFISGYPEQVPAGTRIARPTAQGGIETVLEPEFAPPKPTFKDVTLSDGTKGQVALTINDNGEIVASEPFITGAPELEFRGDGKNLIVLNKTNGKVLNRLSFPDAGESDIKSAELRDAASAVAVGMPRAALSPAGQKAYDAIIADENPEQTAADFAAVRSGQLDESIEIGKDGTVKIRKTAAGRSKEREQAQFQEEARQQALAVVGPLKDASEALAKIRSSSDQELAGLSRNLVDPIAGIAGQISPEFGTAIRALTGAATSGDTQRFNTLVTSLQGKLAPQLTGDTRFSDYEQKLVRGAQALTVSRDRDAMIAAYEQLIGGLMGVRELNLLVGGQRDVTTDATAADQLYRELLALGLSKEARIAVIRGMQLTGTLANPAQPNPNYTTPARRRELPSPPPERR